MEANDCYENYKTLGQTITDWKDEFEEEETPNKASKQDKGLFMAIFISAILTLKHLF
jgi:hypothetical protein